jgi:hypothetical protein
VGLLYFTTVASHQSVRNLLIIKAKPSPHRIARHLLSHCSSNSSQALPYPYGIKTFQINNKPFSRRSHQANTPLRILNLEPRRIITSCGRIRTSLDNCIPDDLGSSAIALELVRDMSTAHSRNHNINLLATTLLLQNLLFTLQPHPLSLKPNHHSPFQHRFYASSFLAHQYRLRPEISQLFQCSLGSSSHGTTRCVSTADAGFRVETSICSLAPVI